MKPFVDVMMSKRLGHARQHRRATDRSRAFPPPGDRKPLVTALQPRGRMVRTMFTHPFVSETLAREHRNRLRAEADDRRLRRTARRVRGSRDTPPAALEVVRPVRIRRRWALTRRAA